MKRGIEQLKANHFDILVIGGGINGCAISRDAALRGASVALIEKDDFASGASGKTTKLIHGGIRYLEQFNFKLVSESLRERAILLRQAPHLVKPLEFIIPVYKHGPRPLLKIKAGVFIYDWLAGSNNIHPHRSLKKHQVLSLEQNMDFLNLKGGVIYYDAQMDDIRLCLDNAISAYDTGASLSNKTEAVGFSKDKGRIIGIEAQDKLSGEKFLVRASIVINATGAWSNRIVKLDEPASPDITRPTKGVHIVYGRLPHQRAILLSAQKDKRVFFIIPWRGYTLIGTTDTDYSGSADDVYADAHDVEYLLQEAGRVFGLKNLDKKGIITTFASLRPLVNTQHKLTWQVSREHLIKESRSGLISVVGGKYTTYRHLAEQAVDLALAKIEGKNFKECVTHMAGPSSPAPAKEKNDLPNRIEHAVKEEMANSLIDLLARRLQLSVTPAHGLEYLKECADIMAALLGWPDTKKEQEISLYKEEVRKNMNF
ncbi:MAG: glycerol-3-phosphate dehydrogenase/oxidase [Candidatus Omnitrophota bacterium]|nr:glycerol-3-phosphate dehydrogenase/oxidase [Candidatus Omnitrophota bacterium]